MKKPNLAVARKCCRRLASGWLLVALIGCTTANEPRALRIEGRLDAPISAAADAPIRWVVELRDDSADQVLAEQRGTASAPLSAIVFAINVDPERADPTHRHSVRGALVVDDEVRWLSAPLAVDLPRPGPIDVGSLHLAPYVFPGAFASTFDCGGRRVTIGHRGDRLRLIDGQSVHDLAPVPGSRRPRYEQPGEPGSFVQFDDAGATVSIEGRPLLRCTLVAPPR